MTVFSLISLIFVFKDKNAAVIGLKLGASSKYRKIKI